jgi:hypothetical protein
MTRLEMCEYTRILLFFVFFWLERKGSKDFGCVARLVKLLVRVLLYTSFSC